MFFIRFRQLRLLIILLALISTGMYLLQAKWVWKLFYPWPYHSQIAQVASRTELDPCMLAAIVRVESRFNPHAESAVGARGLMQVMPATATWVAGQIGLKNFHEDQLYQPEVNLLIGSWYLAHLFQDFGGNQVTGLAAYNAGRGNVHAWLETGQWKGTASDIKNIPFPETQAYLRAVLRDYDIYRYLYEDRQTKAGHSGGS